jgi:hypothetical protein
MEISADDRVFQPTRGRARWLGVLALAAAGIVGCAQVGNSPGTAASEMKASAAAPSASAYESAEASGESSALPDGAAPRLLVLGGADAGRYSLWTRDPKDDWTEIKTADGATAIGRNPSQLILGGPDAVETRPLGGYAEPRPVEEQKWHFAQPVQGVPAIALSPGGRAALVSEHGSDWTYTIENQDAELVALSPAPVQPFSPLVGWLGEDRIVALSTDERQISRLAVIDPTNGTRRLLSYLSGVRVFTMSPDGSVMAAATEEGVYIGPVSAWLADEPAKLAFAVPDQVVVWALALDSSGTRLAMMSGRVGADGTVADLRELVFESTPSGWRQTLDERVPFMSVAGQIWLS